MRTIIALFFFSIVFCGVVAAQEPYGARTYDGPRPPALTEEEIRVMRKSAEYHLGRPLDAYYFLGREGSRETPPPGRTGCVWEKEVPDQHVPGLYHSGWFCDPLAPSAPAAEAYVGS